MALCDSDERSGESHPPRWLRLEEAPCRSENGSRNISKTNLPLSIYNRPPPIEHPLLIKNASSLVACWRVIGNHKQEAVKVAGCLSTITFKSQKESQNLKSTDQSKKVPTYLRVPAPQPPEPMISIARKQRVYILRERAAFFCNFSFRLWRKKS